MTIYQIIDNWVALFIAIFVGLFICSGVGYYYGRTTAFDDIISEKCWLQKPELDIACTAHIAN